MSSKTATLSGRVVRIEWERFHHVASALLLLADGRIVRVHSQHLGETAQEHLVLTRDGDEIEVTIAEDPEPHALQFINKGIAAMAKK
jgi:hypothetical protein